MVNDTISDFLTRIRNANNSKHQLVEVEATKMTLNLANILKEEGLIEDFQNFQDGITNSIIISLKYFGQNRKPVISELKRISKPGIRVYTRKKDIPNLLGNVGVSILSTSQGVMSDRKAKSLKIGGEILCRIS
jgi:small subunit ribosomal protein S8